MDNICFAGSFNLRLILFFLTTMLLDIMDGSSIFNIMLGNQPVICNSLIESKNVSISGQGVVHPRAISNAINFEYIITTPNFPLNYPTNIQCIALIKAPSFDYQIVLEVRQVFDIEPSKHCVRDFLEITDGPYGFSKRIGKYCNTNPPPKEIRSSGSFLWLRFRSDKNLALRGFKVAYRFIRDIDFIPQRNYCYKQTIIPPGGSFNFSTSFLLAKLKEYIKIPDNNTYPLECVFDFHVSPGFLTYAYTAEFTKPNNPNPCSTNKMEIYNKHTFDINIKYPHKLNYFKICYENDFVKHLLKYSTRTTIRIITTDLEKLNSISIILTSVKITKNTCPTDYFLCSSKPKLCISKKLICNNEPNCPELNDENCSKGELLKLGVKPEITSTHDPVVSRNVIIKAEEAKIQRNTNKIHAMILGSIASILILSMIFCLLLTIHSKKKDKNSHDINVVDVPMHNQKKFQSKTMFYELLQSSEPSVAALSTDRLNRKVYNKDNNQIWTKKSLQNISTENYNFHCKSNGGMNGDIKIKSTIKPITNHYFKSKVDAAKGSSFNKIGKYLSVPYPAKNEIIIKPFIPKKSYNKTLPSEDLQSWSSNSLTKQNSLTNRSIHHIQRPGSMSSGLRRHLQERMKGNAISKNVEWYCGPVIKDENIKNNSFEILNAYSVKSSKHVPGCRSLPNFYNVEFQNPVNYTKPISSKIRHTITDSLDYNADDNSSDIEDNHPTFFIPNYRENNNIYKYPEFIGSNNEEPSHYGFKYFCAHNTMDRDDFVEYVA